MSSYDYYDQAFFYKTHSLAGLIEAQRLLKLAHAKEAPKKLDTQVIFECFEGMTILYLCGFSLKIFQSLYKSWADTNLEAETDKGGN